MAALILSPDELQEITGKRQPTAVARVLDAIGVPYRRRPNGTIVVFREELIPHAPAQNRPPPPKLRLL